MTTATRERLTSAVITLHHPLDYYFGLFLRAKKTEGLMPRTLNDHESHYRYLQTDLASRIKLKKVKEDTTALSSSSNARRTIRTLDRMPNKR